MTPLVLDSSAVLAILLNESGAAAARERIETASRLTASRLLRVEVERAILRLALDAPRRAAAVMAVRRRWAALSPTIDVIEMTPEICALAARIAPRVRLRALDAIHLATFDQLRRIESSFELLSLDRRLLEASRTI